MLLNNNPTNFYGVKGMPAQVLAKFKNLFFIMFLALAITSCTSDYDYDESKMNEIENVEYDDEATTEATEEDPDLKGDNESMEEEMDKIITDEEISEEDDSDLTKEEEIAAPIKEESQTEVAEKEMRTEEVSEKEAAILGFEQAAAEAATRRPPEPDPVEQEEQAWNGPQFLVEDDTTEEMKDLSDLAQDHANVSFLASTIYHSSGQADLNAQDARALREVVRFYKKYGGVIKVIGHSSSRTKNMKMAQHLITNFKMSIKRANIVGERLKGLGIPSHKLYIGAVSDNEPIKRENMPINEATNRRTEIYIDY